MSKESDTIKREAKILGHMGITYFVCALYLGLTSIAMHGTQEEIESGIFSLVICGCVPIFGMLAYLIINLKKLKEETDT